MRAIREGYGDDDDDEIRHHQHLFGGHRFGWVGLWFTAANLPRRCRRNNDRIVLAPLLTGSWNIGLLLDWKSFRSRIVCMG